MLAPALSTLGLVALAWAGPAPHAAFLSNLAYRSPSLNVADLAIPLSSVQQRLGKRWNDVWAGNVSFPCINSVRLGHAEVHSYGVASGDPYSDSVILQTIAQPYDLEGVYGNPTQFPVCVHYAVSKSATDFSRASLVADGYAQTTFDVGNSIKVEAVGLQPYTQYHYRFEACDSSDLGQSIVGSFKTLPAENDDVTKIRLAVYSCSNLPFGYFHAYGAAANRSDQIDYVQHVGDYSASLQCCLPADASAVYEYANGQYGDGTKLGRIPQPNRECSSLQDYRDRYAGYRTDPQLQALHQKVAWQVVWDDHEVADNTWVHGSADSNDTAAGRVGDYQFAGRKANAVRAYFEWMPIRQVQTDDNLRIWRNFKIDMVMADTRHYNRSITDVYYNTDSIRAVAADANRSMTGAVQEQWIFDQFDQSKARGAQWRLLMQQVVFGTVNYTTATNGSTDFDFDDWEGYRAQRQRIVSHLADNKINNTIILSGDSHASWVNEIPRNQSKPSANYDPSTGAGSVAVEFAGSAVSSPSSYGSKLNATQYKAIASSLVSSNPALQYAEGQMRGYFELLVTPANVTAEFYGWTAQQLLLPPSNATLMGTFVVASNTQRLVRPINGGVAPQYGALQGSS